MTYGNWLVAFRELAYQKDMNPDYLSDQTEAAFKDGESPECFMDTLDQYYQDANLIRGHQ